MYKIDSESVQIILPEAYGTHTLQGILAEEFKGTTAMYGAMLDFLKSNTLLLHDPHVRCPDRLRFIVEDVQEFVERWEKTEGFRPRVLFV